MSLGEVFPAVCEAEKAVGLNPNWWIGHQTLGRAQLGLGEVKLVSLFHCTFSGGRLRNVKSPAVGSDLEILMNCHHGHA